MYDIESKLCNLHGPCGIAVSKKLDQVLIKNKGLNSLKQIYKIITGARRRVYGPSFISRISNM